MSATSLGLVLVAVAAMFVLLIALLVAQWVARPAVQRPAVESGAVPK